MKKVLGGLLAGVIAIGVYSVLRGPDPVSASYFGPLSPSLEAARGNISGFRIISGFGETLDADANVPTDVWDGADGVTSTDIWVAPTAARIHDISSTSASDDGAPVGVGMRTIRIFGLTGFGTSEVSEDITLDGTTNVPTANSYVIINDLVGLTFGDDEDLNIGVITATAQTDGTVSAAIQPGRGKALMMIMGVPSTQTFFLRTIVGTILTNTGADAQADAHLLVKRNADQSDSGFITFEAWLFIEGWSPPREYMIPRPIAGPAILKIQVVSNANNSAVIGSFDGILIDN